VSYSWTRRGERRRIPYENPEGRRVNVLAAYSPYGSQPALSWGPERGSIVGKQFVDWIQRIPRLPGKPLVIVLDNGSLHRNGVVKAALPALRAQRLYLYFLPPYSPELNEIEAIFGVVKRNELPERRYTTWERLEAAIITGFTHIEDRLLQKCTAQSGLAA
jgi:transposase